jgi:putative transcriptional regulator
MSKAGKRLLRSADEMLAIARGEAKPARVHVPPDVDVKAIRRKLVMSQEAFATEFSFTLTQIRDWEQGRSRPLDNARAYLLIIDRRPEVVRKVLVEMRAEAVREREEDLAFAM